MKCWSHFAYLSFQQIVICFSCQEERVSYIFFLLDECHGVAMGEVVTALGTIDEIV